VYITSNNKIFALFNAAATAAAGFAAFLQLQSKKHESVSCEFFL
jgi:predicted RND superfamily exporter protein